jgi:hypothetical protein
MAGSQDPSEFIDTDFTAQKPPFSGAPTRDDTDRKLVEAQQKLVELKRVQEDLERERSGLEELRRRQAEFVTGREEIVRQLTRATGLLEEAEFAARRDAELMVKTLVDFRDALGKVQGIHDETWTKENFQTELTRALTTVESARMEWNSARLKLPVLAGEAGTAAGKSPVAAASAAPTLADLGFGRLCQIGLAFTWPLLVVGLAILLAVLERK